MDFELIQNAVHAAEKIDGWMHVDELQWLAESASSRKIVIEIGSWKGRSTKAIAMCCPGTVYAVDDWRGSEDPEDQTSFQIAKYGKQFLYLTFMQNLNDEIKSGKLAVLRHSSTEALDILTQALGERKADMIFIDGDHTYDSVKRDIQAYMPLVAKDGLLCGHDAVPSIFPQVVQAVRELVPDFKYGAGSIWYKIL